MSLEGKKVAILTENGFEDLELHYPRLRLIEEGAEVVVATPDGRDRESKHGYPARADAKISELNPEEFSGLVVPGGLANPDKLRTDKDALDFIRKISEEGKTVAAICHGPWVLVSAGIMKGKKATCYHTIIDDLKNAGAEHLDKEVVADGNIITSRMPDDLPAFMREVIKSLEGRE